MPPRAPTPDTHVVDDLAMAPVDSAKALEIPPPPKKGPLANTFHWELNLYSFAALGLMYYATPEHHRVFWNFIFALIALDSARYYYNKGSMAGVPYTLPFVSFLAMLFHPVRFWAEMANIAMTNEGMCSNTLVGNFMFFVTDPKLCREVMTGEGTYGIYAHPNALWLFGEKNLIYLPKELHKKVRGILSPALFSNEALQQYAHAQEKIVREFMQRYVEDYQKTGKPINAQFDFRSMAAASSQESFMGPYINDEQRVHLEKDILTFTMGFLSFPFPYFNFGLHKAIQAKNRIEKTIREIVPKARVYVQAGNKPRCMMEHWSLAIIQAAKEQGVDPQEVQCCHDDDMARTVLDFLFAAQDATNSALTYTLDVLDAHRNVLDKMRQEVDSVCQNGPVAEKVRDGESLPYINKVANQMLHHKPPVPMIPHLTKKNTNLAGHTIRKGTIAIPSIMYSARVSGASIEFLPEREDADPLFVKTVTFGAGQHKCPGRRYAECLLNVFLAVLAQEYDFERTGPRPSADEFIYYPTIFPVDSKFIIRKRAD